MNKFVFAIVLIFPCLAGAVDYREFLQNVYTHSKLIKMRNFDLEAEKNNAAKTSYYFSPKVTLTSAYKKDLKHADYFDSQANVNVLLYNTSLPERFQERDVKLKGYVVAIDIEKGKIAKSVLENAISIYYYDSLRMRAHELGNSAESLYAQINNRYINGSARASDLQQAMLLVQRINGEIKKIEQEIKNFRSNIELSTGVAYPEEGIHIPEELVKRVYYTKVGNDLLNRNLEYIQLEYQSEELKLSAEQQNTLVSVSMIGQEKFNNSRNVKSDTYVGISVDVNVFDLDKYLNKNQKMNQYRSAKARMDYKYQELSANLKLLDLQYNASNDELDNLMRQLKTTSNIIISQKKEYDIGRISYYEMLNTQFDYFNLEVRIAERKIRNISNRLSSLVLVGDVLTL